MKILHMNEIATVSGGADITIYQKISTDGLSDACVNAIPSLVQFSQTNPSEEAFLLKALSACTLAELELINERLGSTAPFKVELCTH